MFEFLSNMENRQKLDGKKIRRLYSVLCHIQGAILTGFYMIGRITSVMKELNSQRRVKDSQKQSPGGVYINKAFSEDLPRYQKETQTQVFSCEYCKIVKNTYFEEHLRTNASGLCLIWSLL